MTNKIHAIVKSLEVCEILYLTHFAFGDFSLSMISLELEDLNINDKVILTAKPTAIAIAKDIKGYLSYSNQLQGVIIYIQYGQLLTDIQVQVNNTNINSIITTNSAKRMDLKKNELVTCLIKASDLSIFKRSL